MRNHVPINIKIYDYPENAENKSGIHVETGQVFTEFLFARA